MELEILENEIIRFPRSIKIVSITTTSKNIIKSTKALLTHPDYFHHLKQLIALEEDEENEEDRNAFFNLGPKERELRGRALLDLVLVETEFSPAGHALVTFTRRNKTPLPIFSLQTGDVVRLASSHHKTGDTLSGTIYEKFSDRIIVAFNKELSEEWEREENFELYKSVNRVTYRRMEEALDAVNETRNTRLAVFRDISFKEKKPSMERINLDDITWFDSGLNQSQKEAVRMALSAKDVGLVHGPPGTGKTTVLIEIIRQAVLRGHSVLVNAPSNTACDNILEMLIHKGINALRLGHPARINRDLREHTLDFKLGQHAYGKLIVQNENELHRLFRTQERYRERRIPGSYAEREAGEEIRHLKQEVKILKK